MVNNIRRAARRGASSIGWSARIIRRSFGERAQEALTSREGEESRSHRVETPAVVIPTQGGIRPRS
ncbi:MAG TPA: hypothetical protein VFX03_10015, partial [Thermomicrobiales bacterium]|nr:hypothetical protein [Thermomicrobiales bacterium]